MNYNHIYYDKESMKYKIRQEISSEHRLRCDNGMDTIAVFSNFHMAYAYISMLNGTNVQNVYSRWAVE